MQEDAKEARKSQYKLLLNLLLIIFLAITAYTIFWEVRYIIRYNHFQKVEAEVVDHEIDGENVYDVLEYFVDGVEYRKTTSYQSKNEIGDVIVVYYDIQSPVGVIYSLDYRRYALPIITVMMGAVYLSFYFMYKISFPKTKKKPIKKEATPVDILLGNK